MERRIRRGSPGQGMTEYIIVVALIAIAAIGVFNYFGRTVRFQGAAVSEGLAGQAANATTDTTNAGKQANGAGAIAPQASGMSNFGNDTDAKQ